MLVLYGDLIHSLNLALTSAKMGKMFVAPKIVNVFSPGFSLIIL